ncbi:MAG: hypothetical protein M3Z14_04500 [Candidatus Eremiobacteraeota bacterium]|nr:hypothetical protein [Candidatus Eremiobacteraeota bacterium]
MISPFYAFTASFLLLLSSVSPAFAQDQNQPLGFSAKGTVVAQASFSGQRFNLGMDIGVMQRGNLYRIDIDRIALPGADPAVSALAAQFLPQGSFSALYDYSSRRMTVWSNANKTYTVRESKAGAAATPQNATTAGGPDIFKALTFGKDVQKYKVYELSTRLTGPSQANGHRTHAVALAFRMQPNSGQAVEASGTLNFADDLDGFLTRASFAFRQPQQGSLQVDLTSVTRSAPAETLFAIPDGYRKVDDLSGVLGKNIPFPH